MNVCILNKSMPYHEAVRWAINLPTPSEFRTRFCDKAYVVKILPNGKLSAVRTVYPCAGMWHDLDSLTPDERRFCMLRDSALFLFISVLPDSNVEGFLRRIG